MLRSLLSRFTASSSVFSANFLSLPDFHVLVNPCLFFALRPPNSLLAVGSLPANSTVDWNLSPLKKSAPRKISMIDRAFSARATRAHRRNSPGSCNGLFSVGFPTVAQGLLPRLTIRTSITTASHFPQSGQTIWSPRGLLLTATFRSYQSSLLFASRSFYRFAVFDLLAPTDRLTSLNRLTATFQDYHSYFVFANRLSLLLTALAATFKE